MCSGSYGSVPFEFFTLIIFMFVIAIGKPVGHVFKVPECANFHTDSGAAAVCNAIWLSSTRRRGHPGECLGRFEYTFNILLYFLNI